MILRYLTGRGAAKVIGCSYTTVQTLTRSGELPKAAEDQNGKPLYDPDVIAAFAKTYVDGRTRDSRERGEAREAVGARDA